MTTTQPPPAPTWHREITDLLSIQQAEVFVLSGDTAGYPQFPGEGVPDYLRRQALAPIRRQLAADLKAKGKDWSDWTQGQQEKALAALMVCCWIAPAAGLSFYTEADRAQFDRVCPPPEGNPFAVAGPAALPAEFGRLGKYFANPEAPPLCLIVQHADLIFSPDVPLNPQDTLLLSYLRLWSSKPLLTGSGAPHRIFLVAGPTAGSVKPDLFGGGRITAVKVPLPTEAQRTAFVSLLLQGAQEDNRPLQFEEGLTAPLLGRITGALNLLQVEDVVYRAELEGGTITRAAVQVRKDLLVKSAFGGVLTIDYPDDNWGDLVGYEALKLEYFQGYVYPLLKDANPGCPKGCILTGPPGTGKSKMARCLAGALKLPLVSLQGEKLKDKYVGSSNKNVARFIEGVLALSPCIVLIDEIEKILPTSDDNTGVSQEILGQLQTALSDFPGGLSFWIATTNFPDRIPAALLRPGRLEETLPMLPAHLDGLRHIALPVVARQHRYTLDPGTALMKIGDAAANYTGADLGKLLRGADQERQKRQGETINTADLETALTFIVPTLSKPEARAMQDKALEYCDNRRYLPPSLADRAGTPKPTDPPKPRRKVNKITDDEDEPTT